MLFHITLIAICSSWAWANPLPLPLALPIDIVYTGAEGCACPRELGYQLNIPQVPQRTKYLDTNYGYRIERPPKPKGKVTYRFDFTVEEPRTPKPVHDKKWNLFAKVDRVTANREDCVSSGTPYKPHTYGCSCAQCGGVRPQYRYVDQPQPLQLTPALPCNCQHPQCMCNAPLPIVMPDFDVAEISTEQESSSSSASPSPSSSNVIKRGKRELQDVFYRKRRLSSQNQPRTVKIYNKDLNAYDGIGFLNRLFAPATTTPRPTPPPTRKSKRKTKKVLAPVVARWLQARQDYHKQQQQQRGPQQQSKRRHHNKRDIKGEYDLMEKERQEFDLTLPEIIQFMPETLRSDFKRGQCHFGCADKTTYDDSNEMPMTKTTTTTTKATSTDKTTPTTTSATKETQTESNETMETLVAPPEKNTIPAKRNIPNWNYGLQLGNEYQQISTTPRTVYATAQDQYTYLPNDKPLRALLSRTIIPDPLASSATPLQFAGDLEATTRDNLYGSAAIEPLLGGAATVYSLPRSNVGIGAYPVEHLSNAELDRIISNIVYRHPEFIDATAHYGGALVDPEPVQRAQTTDFLKKLIHRRLNIWPGEAPPSTVKQPTQSSAATSPAAAYSQYESNPQQLQYLSPLNSYLPSFF